jgi:hypothetical protein
MIDTFKASIDRFAGMLRQVNIALHRRGRSALRRIFRARAEPETRRRRSDRSGP